MVRGMAEIGLAKISFIAGFLKRTSNREFAPGTKVNAVDFCGSVERTDGIVLGSKGSGETLVEWPRDGRTVENNGYLCEILS